MYFRPLIAFGLLAGVASSASAQPTEPVRLGVAAPTSGPSATLGAQVADGARQSAAKIGASVTAVDTSCTAQGGRTAAESLAAAKVAIVVGFLCTESLEAALPVLKAANIPAIDIGVRADRFTAQRRKTGNLVWRLAPKADGEAKAMTALVLSRWRDMPFGILDDGTVQGRALADAVRSGVEAEGLRAATIDTYRPAEEKQFALARRLARTGVTHFVLAGERADAAIIARDAAESGVPLEIAGGEALMDEPPDAGDLPPGTLAIGLADRFPGIGAIGRTDEPSQRGYFGPAYAGAEIGAEAVRAARAQNRTVAEILNDTAFRTALGPVRFDANGDADLGLFRIFRFDGRDFAPESGG